MIPLEHQALVEDTIRGCPSRELIRARGKEWTTEHIDYALSRIQQFTHASQQQRAETLLLELRADIVLAETERKAAARQVATEAALVEIKTAVKLGPKPHWTQSPGFWVAVVAAIAALVAAWPVVRDWLR